MKKQWISVKCGLSRDAKHRQKMGECIWLFLHIIDMTTWEEGIVHEWKDKAVAIEMDMPVNTVRDQRQKLEELGYITCSKKQYDQDIIVHNWTNPREYSGTTKNATRSQSDLLETIPEVSESAPKQTLKIQSDPQSDPQSTDRTSRLHYIQKIKQSNAGGNPIPNVRSAQSDVKERTPDFLSLSVRQARELPTLKMFEKCTNFFPGQILWEYVHNFIMENGITEEKLKDTAIEWVSRGYRINNVKGILEVAAFGWKNEKKENPKEGFNPFAPLERYLDQKELEEQEKNNGAN